MDITGVEETVRRICGFPGVSGLIVTTGDGTIVRTTMDTATTQQYVTSMRPVIDRCISAVRDVDPTNDLEYVRVRSKRFEIMLKTEGDYMLYLIQNPNESHRF